MEVKTLLRIIKDDIAHLETITGDFSGYSLPAADEIEVALVRSNALLRELELLHKIAVQVESSFKAVKIEEKQIAAVEEHHLSEQEPFELFVQEPSNDKDKIINDVPAELNPEKEIKEPVLNMPAQPSFDEYAGSIKEPQPEILLNSSETKEKVADEVLETLEPKEATLQIASELILPVENAFVEAEVVPEIAGQTEEIVAEEFKEVKKTLNESLSDAHQMVNDFLTPEKVVSGFQVLPIHSIWDGIGINDRFLFIRELFSNSSAKFETTIETIDRQETIQDAVDFLKKNFKWNKGEASQKFLLLVKRRFTK